MNKTQPETGGVKPKSEVSKKAKKEIKFQESPVERAIKLSSDQIVAMAIRDLIKRDELN